MTQKRFSATQYALFSSLFALPRLLAGPIAGVSVDAMGWSSFFLSTLAVGIPGLLMLARFVPLGVREPVFTVEAIEPRPPLGAAQIAWRGAVGGLVVGAAGFVLDATLLAVKTMRETKGAGFDLGAAISRLAHPASIADWLRRGAAGEVPETPKASDPLFARVDNRIIATPHRSLEAAADVFLQAGVTPVILGDTVTGEAREVAKVYAALVREIAARGAPFAPPVALISGGECTVTLPAGSSGRGGRCTEFLLSLAVELEAVPNLHALAADTDGIDGSETNAGAWLDPRTAAAAAAQGVTARAALDAHDAWGYFDAAGRLLVTGPTRTNVNDYRVIVLG
jgi:hypothetical protein